MASQELDSFTKSYAGVLDDWAESCDTPWPWVEPIWQAADLADLIVTRDDGVTLRCETKQPTLEHWVTPLWNSIDELDTSALSRLTRVVRDWSVAAEEASAVVFADFGTGKTSAFVDLVYQAQHRLLERKRDKPLWAWYLEWQRVTLALARPGRSLNGREILEMLKRALRSRRSRRRSWPSRVRHAPAERLRRLADSIAPNAPPLPPQLTDLVTEAG